MRVLARSVALILTVALAACGAAGAASPSPTPTPTTPGAGAVGGGGGGTTGGGGNGGGNNGGAAASPAPSQAPTTDPSPTELITVPGGPYVVDETVGDSKVTGIICDLERPFTLSVAASRVSFTMALTPRDATTGSVNYAYTISSAGESDTATGTYQVGAPATTGVRKISLRITDHSVFKGFDGNIPIRQTLTLTPQSGVPCP